jgi:thiol-disulfide isomerase/thioredoxin
MSRISLILLALALGACTPSEAEGPGDDGGSDDGGDDGGGDGGDDGGAQTPYGPDNEWWHVAAEDMPADLEGTGRSTGDVAPNFTLVDQNGDEVELYQFYGQVIMLDVFAQWCGPCQDMAPHGQSAVEDYGEQGFVLLAIMEENTQGRAPGADDIQDWADSYGLTHPVLADEGYSQGSYVVAGYPTLVVIDRDMTIAHEDLWPFSATAIEALL